MLAEVVLSSSPSSQLAAGFPRCHARPRMRDSNEIMPALVFKYENAHIESLITHTIELKLFRDYSKWAGWIDSAPSHPSSYTGYTNIRYDRSGRFARAGRARARAEQPTWAHRVWYRDGNGRFGDVNAD
eukprot:COSAG02_NODE_2253_length_9348_cov_21.784842_4_plen_129_part_00